MLIYKILRTPEWTALNAAGRTAGAPVDVDDGYVHFSTGAQVGETLTKHFGKATGLVLLACESDNFGAALHWEPSRGGALFPHLYRMLDIADVASVRWLVDGPEGPVIPEDLSAQARRA
jgi:uncharacterized protein (DUF952 family)